VSIPVALEGLREALRERGDTAYLLTVSDDGRPHAVHLPFRWHGAALVMEVGKRTAANAVARPGVSLLAPVRSADDYSLIIDGTALVAETAAGRELSIMPMKAVLHRAAAAPDPSSACGADCVTLVPPARRDA
jgi:hypothetical protein